MKPSAMARFTSASRRALCHASRVRGAGDFARDPVPTLSRVLVPVARDLALLLGALGASLSAHALELGHLPPGALAVRRRGRLGAELRRRLECERLDPAPVGEEGGREVGRGRAVVARARARLVRGLRVRTVAPAGGEDRLRRAAADLETVATGGAVGDARELAFPRGVERRRARGQKRGQDRVRGAGRRGLGRGGLRGGEPLPVGLEAGLDGVEGVVDGDLQNREQTRFGQRVGPGRGGGVVGHLIPAQYFVGGHRCGDGGKDREQCGSEGDSGSGHVRPPLRWFADRRTSAGGETIFG